MRLRQIVFKEFVTLQRGFDLPTSQREEGQYPVVAATAIHGYHNACKVKPPGVTTGRSGALGKVLYLEQPFWPLNTTLWVKDFKGNLPRYVYYFLKTMNLKRWDAGTGVPTLNRNHLDNVEITVHLREDQEKIAAILSAYDDLIENNTRRIQILEEMARALYREWVVNFRFPGHEKVKMVESELGPIPEGWEVKKLSELVETQYGYTETASEDEVGPKFVRGTDINKTPYIQWDTVPYCPISSEEYSKYKLNVGDIVVIRMADPGKVGIVEKEIDAVFASYLIRFNIISSKLSPYYLFYFLLSDRYQNYATGASTGTTRKSASAGVLADINIVIPQAHIRESFEGGVTAIRRMLNNLLDKNANLRQTRDLLLPRLISGDLDVLELDIATEELKP